jgi:O-antigen/teichoic acid export membrane protein
METRHNGHNQTDCNQRTKNLLDSDLHTGLLSKPFGPTEFSTGSADLLGRLFFIRRPTPGNQNKLQVDRHDPELVKRFGDSICLSRHLGYHPGRRTISVRKKNTVSKPQNEQTTEPSTHETDDETIKNTGRGFIVITIAKVWFLLTGAVIQLGLPIVFDSAQVFGVFKIVTETISLINMVVIVGTLQAVSKLISERPEDAKRVVHLALKLQCFIGLPLTVAYALCCPSIADAFHDPSLTPLMRLSSLIIGFYAFYAIFIGYFNGLKSFVHQAAFDIIFATLKVAGILGLVLLGFGVFGAVLGFVVAAGCICILAALYVLRSAKKHAERHGSTTQLGRDDLKKLLAFLLLTMFYTFALNGLMRVDLFVLKSVASEAPTSMESAHLVFSSISNTFSGFYGASLNLARIPYQGVIAVTFVIFPLISQSTFADDIETTRRYIRSTYRYCMLLIASVASVLIFNADSLIAGLYSGDYLAASSALSFLSFSIIFFALLFVATTIMIGAGHPLAAGILMSISMITSAILNHLFVSQTHRETLDSISWVPIDTQIVTTPQLGIQHAISVAQSHSELAGPLLARSAVYVEQAAIATTIAMVLGCGMAVGWLYRKFQVYPPTKTLLRLVLAALILWGIDSLLPIPPEWVAEFGKLKFMGLVLAKMAMMGAAVILTLVAAREFTKSDLEGVLKVIGKKKETTSTS